MKIQKLKSNNTFTGSPCTATQKALEKTAKTFAKMGNIGEGASIACDFFGKALVVPLMIMATSKEPKEKKEYSAFKNPTAAVIQVGLEVPILAAGSKLVGNCANKGMFDVKGSDFSYNEQLKKVEFIDKFEKSFSPLDDTSKKFLNDLKSKGYSSDIQERFDDITSGFDDAANKNIKNSFKDYEKTYKNLFHLKNRVCFAAALILTPLLCALENEFHPVVMNKIFKLQHLDKKPHVGNHFITFDKFIKNARLKGGVVK